MSPKATEEQFPLYCLHLVSRNAVTTFLVNNKEQHKNDNYLHTNNLPRKQTHDKRFSCEAWKLAQKD